MIVTTPTPSAMVAPTASLSTTSNVSGPSIAVSPFTLTVIPRHVSPALNLTVPIFGW